MDIKLINFLSTAEEIKMNKVYENLNFDDRVTLYHLVNIQSNINARLGVNREYFEYDYAFKTNIELLKDLISSTLYNRYGEDIKDFDIEININKPFNPYDSIRDIMLYINLISEFINELVAELIGECLTDAYGGVYREDFDNISLFDLQNEVDSEYSILLETLIAIKRIEIGVYNED